MLDIATILGAIGVSDALSECRENPEYQARGNIFNSDAEEDPPACQDVAEAFEAMPFPVVDLTMTTEAPQGKISKCKQ
ncbi:hypothetical protein Pmar_PMAR002333 [Perkinsus marinus ATCC 50983]|uniref:Uncharacterized protein n=1 Tax=Perkinsus marinus (strain ATCC 50983 / TXsc) TaxID=423536 RepID=C5KV16_PERM5|nr:hypothetical protein Pmar_PMAR011395 [Perkinsus marinus ATCC 50983]XP_002779936.1 hypothetical protein Pmar_PMAR002333 [Perkinsus marinus ATCC 50983]EER06565.1 hypothetical protein Pmar_PMAR011395 [Perkinsus marinus ATCC 50983]EER11731.1 hypothetical protein Pmar_PMAR002333 [Perkinsus marinus ATCC 50983]|eukprot:XP_002774749.1 hypothetical protein Pmar_PMAR011395 [Perkinsus marinus ATCC 50983]